MNAATEVESVILSSTTVQAPELDNYFDFGNSVSTAELSIFGNTDAQIQVKKYLREPVTNNLLAVSVYPIVKNFFLKYNTPLPSSAPVERLFSYATMHNLPRYNRLADENFEIRVLTKCNASKNLQ